MAELILTEEEKKAATWMEFDDATIGKVVKAASLAIVEIGNEQRRIWWFSAVMALCCMVSDANVDKFTQEIKGLTFKGESLGDWKITIRKVIPGLDNKPNEPDAYAVGKSESGKV